MLPKFLALSSLIVMSLNAQLVWGLSSTAPTENIDACETSTDHSNSLSTQLNADSSDSDQNCGDATTYIASSQNFADGNGPVKKAVQKCCKWAGRLFCVFTIIDFVDCGEDYDACLDKANSDLTKCQTNANTNANNCQRLEDKKARCEHRPPNYDACNAQLAQDTDDCNSSHTVDTLYCSAEYLRCQSPI